VTEAGTSKLECFEEDGEASDKRYSDTIIGDSSFLVITLEAVRSIDLTLSTKSFAWRTQTTSEPKRPGEREVTG
jgi:hypothetical protein